LNKVPAFTEMALQNSICLNSRERGICK